MKKDTLVVKGLAGKKSLNGEVRIFGAKNDVLKAMASSILFSTPIVIQNVPKTEDVDKMRNLLIGLGATISEREHEGSHELTIDASQVTSHELDADLAKSMRASVVLTGSLLARFGKAVFPIPGGCVIGPRPIDLFIAAYEKMGAHVKLESDAQGDRYVISAKELTATEIFFNIQTVGGTETIMMAAIGATGTTVLKNCAMEPEIQALAEYLNSCGADITGAGTPTMKIRGTGLLKARANKPYVTMPDRIETGSFLFLGALCADTLRITHCNPAHVEATISLLQGSGVPIVVGPDTIEIRGNAAVKNSSLAPFNVRTHEYPGFPTDLQPQASVYLTQVGSEKMNPNSGMKGESIVFETIYEGRFKFVSNLEKMGAAVTVMNPREILIKGCGVLKAPESGDEINAYDIRAGFAMIIAALCASGTSVINNVYFIDRGYENIEGRLSALGADIRRVHGE
ncbi:MAG: hypothetical protein RIT04_147 [Candidatus Parcubacteria bacterium]|jgi:UDP-N-acetylglucosamine 1-carboxyvinyltransferase